MGTVTGRYVPATTRAQLSPESKNLAMDALLMSDQIATPTRRAAKDISFDAAELALAEAYDTGQYASSFRVEESAPIAAGSPAFPRRTYRVVNDDDAAAAVEYGNVRIDPQGREVVMPARRILGRAGFRYHTPRGIG